MFELKPTLRRVGTTKGRFVITGGFKHIYGISDFFFLLFFGPEVRVSISIITIVALESEQTERKLDLLHRRRFLQDTCERYAVESEKRVQLSRGSTFWNKKVECLFKKIQTVGWYKAEW